MSVVGDRQHPDPVIDVLLRELDSIGDRADLTRCAIIDRADAELTTAMHTRGAASLRTFCDVGFTHPRPEAVDLPDLTDGATLVVGFLPKSLAELDEIAAAVATKADASVVLLLAAREQHLVRAMNDVLERHFTQVRASRGARKSRVLVASGPRDEVVSPYPLTREHEELSLTVCAHGGVFARNELDLGTRALLGALGALPGGRMHPAPIARPVERAVDLGCGSGILAAVLARSYPHAEVIATDRSWAACASASATAAANGLDNVRVVRADAGSEIANDSVDLVLCNPPFHDGRGVVAGMANPMFAAAGRMLRPGGACYTVFNSHLRHREFLERYIGPTTQVTRTPKFTVTRSVAE